ncbi:MULTISPECIES: uroporphyrinogen-III C-methyltransferase [Shouchella]|uniref:Uroporphyrinogen-III C-methyltransferase n=2 Tax=Shouchella TaxID=2893057 RepID=Q5WHK0_SHOC1|nr:uroporphyrinogen-III C-methyltransferase [Shouchella clausii]PAE84228.1 uroporphyrinogen-III C-methyltransferase [Shouchella clausii]BAD64155.1 uroporphyrin-III C-methyltransferase [Shouchella clausii KSM-K16]
MSIQGKVYLVGAGPGDAELLTVKARKVLQQADVVIFDRLANPALIMEVSDHAKLVYAGKQPCKHVLRQGDIQTEMLVHAKKGKTVVRLKGGDPAVFGRVGEEAAYLKTHHIPFEIVPGVTAGTAASIYAGVPATHRTLSSSFAVVTAYRDRDEKKEPPNWRALAQSVDTLMIYMGMKQLAAIVDQLMTHGKPAGTPVLIVEWGTYSRQRSVEGTLETIVTNVANANLANPAVILIGDVVGVRGAVSWFEHKPLSGMGILSLRGETEMTGTLRAQGADVFAAPLQQNKGKIVTDTDIAAVLQTSKNQAVLFFAKEVLFAFLAKLGEKGYDIRSVQGQLMAGTQEVEQIARSLGLQLARYSKKSTLSPVVIGTDAINRRLLPQKITVAIRRLLEEGHLTHAFCETEQEIDDLRLVLAECANEAVLPILTTSDQVQAYAKSLSMYASVVLHNQPLDQTMS